MHTVDEITPDTARLPGPVDDAVTEITPSSQRARIRDLFVHSAVLRQLTARDFRSKYKQSLLGPLWPIIQPLGLLVAFGIVFAGLLDVQADGVAYISFAAAGVTIWVFFQSSLTFATPALTVNISLVRRVPCPRIAIPTGGLIAGMPVVAMPFAITVIASILLGDAPTPRILLAPLGLLWLLILTWGIVTLTSAIAVHFRDILYGLPFLLQTGIFLSPVAFPASRIDSQVIELIFALNPLTGIIDTWRWLVLPMAPPTAGVLISSAIWTVLVAVGGWLFFRRLEPTMADFI